MITGTEMFAGPARSSAPCCSRLDLAKHVFQVHGADPDGRPVLRKRLRRGQVLEFFAGLSPCLIGGLCRILLFLPPCVRALARTRARVMMARPYAGVGVPPAWRAPPHT